MINNIGNKLAKEITDRIDKMILLLSSTLNNHLNLGQNFVINTSEVFLSLEKLSISTLLLKTQIGKIQIRFPSTLNRNLNQIISLRVSLDFLPKNFFDLFGFFQSTMKLTVASFENNLNTNIFNSLSISITDENGNEISINSIEIIIPHHSNLIVLPMIIQNVTSINSIPYNELFYLHYINITNTLPVSTHIEIHALDKNLSYLFIYKFDQIPQINNPVNQIDGWTLFCPYGKFKFIKSKYIFVYLDSKSDSVYTYFLDNQQTHGHQSIIFGLRELNSREMINYCFNRSLSNNFPIINEPNAFTSNYALRVYISGCYYLDQNNQWKSDGLLVSFTFFLFF